MNLSTAISDLLYYHDCVIIPGFGGFVARYSPATIHPTQHLFTAPEKAIVFNKSLNSNDGLLGNHISKKFSVGFSEAMTFIEKEVKQYEIALKAGRRVQIPNIGELYLDVEKNLQFSADRSVNYLLESFGLSEFQSPAIRRTEEFPRVVSMPQAVTAVKKDRKILKKVLIAAAIIPFAITISYLPFHTGLVNKNLSELNPFKFGDDKKSSYTERTHAVKEVKLPEIAFNYSAVVTEPTPQPTEPVKEVVADVVPAPTPAPTSKVVSTLVTSSGSYKFYLIAGCFQSMENAQKFVSELSSKGLAAEIIGQGSNGLYRVACGKFNDRAQAVSFQSEIRKQNTSAWLLAL